MCRAKAAGDRRCPGCNGTAAKNAHNARRRENRAVKKQIIAWAGDHPAHQGIVSFLKGLPPGKAQEWAHQQGAPADVLSPVAHHPFSGDSVRRQLSSEDQFWAGQELIQSIEAMQSLQGGHASEAGLLNGEVTGTMRLDGHSDGSSYNAMDGPVNETRIACFSNGTIGFHKTFAGLDDDCAEEYGQDSAVQPVYEAAAWHLAKSLGNRYEPLVPPCVIRVVDGRMGSLAQGVPGDPGDPTSPAIRAAAHDAAFFDCLIGQQDRHLGNLLVDDSASNLHLIDHGFTFARAGDQVNASMLLLFRIQRGEAALKDHEKRALKNVLKSRDLFDLAHVIGPERHQALKSRAARMLAYGRLLPHGEF
jgi:hypothetical protein